MTKLEELKAAYAAARDAAWDAYQAELRKTQEENRMTDELTEVGGDGIRRSFDEHYDSAMDVREDPTGAMWAIYKQARRIEELEAEIVWSKND